MTPAYAVLVSAMALAACAGGSTMRASPGQENTGAAVALTPAPENTPDSNAYSPPAEESAHRDTTGAEQGYAAYGDSGNSRAAAVDSTNPRPGSGSAVVLEIRRIGQWTHTGVREARRLVIRDANTWAEFWSELGVGDRPAVDFSRDVVIAVAAGQRPSGGHEIAISRVVQTAGELRAEVVETVPGPNCLSTSALSEPVDIVVVQGLAAKTWSFVEQKQVRGCQP
jgi:hypothetical protein